MNDPVPVIGAQLIAAGITGMLGAIFHITRIAPGAGIIDPIIGIAKPPFIFYFVLIIGIALNTVLVILFKQAFKKRREKRLKA
ncbi:hypothetical protein RWE15_02910 [Virgibacillus halophilus]|uniref:Uncharacterized protein n=1 Tax=Tigheibacillus halophilus TaxID=361280 RepID=A0ABU5C3X8_9BACI|nr:hypothetical protein [Virgibacillus halophilus]